MVIAANIKLFSSKADGYCCWLAGGGFSPFVCWWLVAIAASHFIRGRVDVGLLAICLAGEHPVVVLHRTTILVFVTDDTATTLGARGLHKLSDSKSHF